VFVMPVLPYLTDTRAHLDRALGMIAESGASSVMHSALYLKPGTKEWYLAWLDREHPELSGRYRELYARGAYAPKEYRHWLAAKLAPLMRKHGLSSGRTDPATGAVLSSAPDAQARAVERAHRPGDGCGPLQCRVRKRGHRRWGTRRASDGADAVLTCTPLAEQAASMGVNGVQIVPGLP
jgi:hypothetical protein